MLNRTTNEYLRDLAKNISQSVWGAVKETVLQKLFRILGVSILFLLILYFIYFFSIAVTSKQFFGDPIECDPGHAKIDSNVLGKIFKFFLNYISSKRKA